MQSRKENEGYWLLLEKGEEIKATIEKWANGERISGAQVWGIGAVDGAELGYFNINSKKYESRKFPGQHEIVSCTGNINSEGFHAHLSISNGGFAVFGGHLISAKISVVGEFFALPTNPLRKIPAPEFGLKKIELY